MVPSYCCRVSVYDLILEQIPHTDMKGIHESLNSNYGINIIKLKKYARKINTFIVPIVFILLEPYHPS